MNDELAWFLLVVAWLPIALGNASTFRALLIAPTLALLHSYILGIFELWLQHSLDILAFGIPLILLVGGLARFVVSSASKLHLRRHGQSDSVFLGTLLAVVFVFRFMPRRTLGWDAEFIWFYKARVFALHPNKTADILGGSLQGGHQDYPPSVPLLVSDIWRLSGSIDPQTLRLVVATLTLSSLGLLLDQIQQSLPLSLQRRPTTRLTVAVSAFLFSGLAALSGPSGYLDTYLALTLCTLGLTLFRGSTQSEDLFLAIFLAASAPVIKQEGFVFLVVILLAARFFSRQSISLPLIIGVCTSLTWGFTKMAFSIPDSGAGRTVFSSFMKLASGRFSESTDVLRAIEANHWLQIAGFASALALTYFTSICLVRSLSPRPLMLLHAASACYLILLITYIFGAFREKVAWWLDTSLFRLSSLPTALIISHITLQFLVQQVDTFSSDGSQTDIDPPILRSGSRTSVRFKSDGR